VARSLRRRLFVSARRQAARTTLTRAGRKAMLHRERGMMVVPSGNPAAALDRAKQAWYWFKQEGNF
jgi:hypothetical protein